jgi:RHS repeat-associated protein
VNKYYEKNVTTSSITTYYFLGNKLVAKRTGTTLNYILQDHLGGTSVIADTGGNSAGTIRYYSFGLTRSSSGTMPTDEKFTGQRLDGTGLYFYGARYYDPVIGRFVSPDSFMLSPSNPQGLNRYTYVFNNPFRYTDPTGNWPPWLDKVID